MDGRRFDNLLRTLATSRRMLLGGSLAGIAGGPGFIEVEARKKRKRKRTNPVLNAFGCVDVGGKCRGNDELCCSGICDGKKPKPGGKDTSRCVAHDAGGCAVGAAPCSVTHVPCTTSAGKAGFCSTTTGGAAYCTTGSSGECFPCSKDADCRVVCGASAACIACLGCSEGSTCATTDVCDFSP